MNAMSGERRGRRSQTDYMRKVVTGEALAKYVAETKAAGGKVVFTNGVFDILHPGHVRYLNEAATLGDALIVGVNSDASARRLKGSGRPFNDELDRAEVIAALKCVGYVTIFDEDTPYELIKTLGPDVLVKGGDWPVDEIVGADVVKASGGEIYSLPYAEGYSTSALIEKIIASAEEGTGE
jgi:rfaE bifunctional protein nucleotidyltransferase chain/domain